MKVQPKLKWFWHLDQLSVDAVGASLLQAVCVIRSWNMQHISHM